MEGYEEFFRVFGDEVKKFQSTEAGQNFWGCRFIIWTTLRILGKNDEVDDMKECIRIRQIYPDLIFSGFDFVGQEHLGHLVELDEG